MGKKKDPVYELLKLCQEMMKEQNRRIEKLEEVVASWVKFMRGD